MAKTDAEASEKTAVRFVRSAIERKAPLGKNYSRMMESRDEGRQLTSAKPWGTRNLRNCSLLARRQ
jgi:hypothetical protein